MRQWFARDRAPARSAPSAPSAADDRMAIGDIRAKTLGALFVAVGLTFAASMITAWAAAGIVFVLGVALTAAGGVVGLLFSMPRALAVGADIHNRVTHKPDAADATPAPISERMYSINTNLEQVSDWLTKIIVGVGLVEAQRLSAFVWRAATTLGGALNHGQHSLDADSATALALGMILGYPLLGFLTGFFSVRLYISRAIYAADLAVLTPVVYDPTTKQEVDDAYLLKTAAPPNERPPSASTAATTVSSPAVDAALSTPLDRLQSISDLITRGRAALLKGRFDEAASAFELALQKGGPDPAVLLDYARTLARLKPTPWRRIIALLEEARAHADSTARDIQQQVTWELLNAYLYTDPPGGFSAAIRLGDEYVSSDVGNADPYGYVYLAAAHGQAYAYWKERAPELTASEVEKARGAIGRALAIARDQGIEDGIKLWLKSLATSSSADDDLKVLVEDHPEIRTDLGLPPRVQEEKGPT